MIIKFFHIAIGFIILSLLAPVPLSHAGMSYLCRDENGGESISDYPLDGLTCKELGEIREVTAEEKLEYENERDEKARKELRNTAKRSPLKTCFDNANDFYEEQLKKYCKANGLKEKCRSMPVKVARPLQGAYVQKIDGCIQSYKPAKSHIQK